MLMRQETLRSVLMSETAMDIDKLDAWRCETDDGIYMRMWSPELGVTRCGTSGRLMV